MKRTEHRHRVLKAVSEGKIKRSVPVRGSSKAFWYENGMRVGGQDVRALTYIFEESPVHRHRYLTLGAGDSPSVFSRKLVKLTPEGEQLLAAWDEELAKKESAK